MDLILRTAQNFEECTQVTLAALERLAAPIAGAIELLTDSLFNSGKILVLGDASAAADAGQFAALLAGRFEMDRPPLPAVALPGPWPQGPDAAVQALRALGHPGDVLLLIANDEPSRHLLDAIEVAQALELRVVAVTGGAGNALESQLAPLDIHVGVPSERRARAQEVQRLVLHCLCDGIDCLFLGVEDQ